MALEMVLNELSLQPADDIQTARERMSRLILTIKSARSYNVSKTLRARSDIHGRMLAENYSLVNWWYDRQVDREKRRRFASLLEKSKILDNQSDLNEQILSSEFRYDDQLAKGLGAAYLLEALAISLDSKACWDSAELFLEVSKISEESDGEIEEKRVKVVHASQPSHVEAHREWIQTRLQQDVKDGSDLWERKAELLPSLLFCRSVTSQIENLNRTMLRSVVRRLFELQSYCQGWTTGGFDPKQLRSKASPESQVTLNQYSQERTFLCPDDIERTFSWHLRLTPGAWRLYFMPLPETSEMIIGYIGPHLRTVKYH